MHKSKGREESEGATGPGEAVRRRDGEVVVRFEPSGVTWRGRRGTRLYDIAQAAGQRVASACSGTGVCGRCGLRVVQGPAALSPEGRREQKRKQDNRVDPALRLSCLTAVRGDVVITADYW